MRRYLVYRPYGQHAYLIYDAFERKVFTEPKFGNRKDAERVARQLSKQASV